MSSREKTRVGGNPKMSYRHLASLAANHNSALETEAGGRRIGDANPQGYWGI